MKNREKTLINKPTKDLTRDDIAVLKEHYIRLYKRAVPKRVSTTFLHGNVAWGLQAEEQGHDPIQLREKIYQQFKKINLKKIRELTSGTQLIREWQGNTYSVTKTKEGFTYNSKTYTSLTPIAKQITGSHISGPRFFGLKKVSHETKTN